MEWIGSMMGSLVVFALLGPVVVLVASVFVVAVVAPFLPASPTLAWSTFACPVKKRDVTAQFELRPGAAAATDVCSCSAFPEARRVQCKKACIEVAQAATASSPMMPRFSLIAGGTAYRV